ncbi:MAG: [protein-PII] uridylyltransferase [Actinomycetota bacterium]|nr:[protein-PII] uridylyltransferase [Actinomycetota bacterium]
MPTRSDPLASPAPADLDRASLLADRSLRGSDFVVAWTRQVDRWLVSKFDAAAEGRSDVAFVAVGGYGRAELAPFSDLDLMLVHRGTSDVSEMAEALWYPIWDAGMKLGHAVRTIEETLTLAHDDLDTATALLSIRHLAGDAGLTGELDALAIAAWRQRPRWRLLELADAVVERQRRFGEVAFLLEPDLKDGRGGLRDVHALHWAEAARPVLSEGDAPLLAEAYRTLLDVRVELQRVAGRPTDRLSLQYQDSIAAELDEDADQVMTRVAGAARTVAWIADEAWHRVAVSLTGSLSLLGWRSRDRAPGVVLREGEICLEPSADPASDPVLLLRVSAIAAEKRARLARATLDQLVARAQPLTDPWPDEARRLFVDLLRCGHQAIPIIEALDQSGLWGRLFPEWEPIRSRPQRNAYHRFTVDRHLYETAANAAALADRVQRPDLLVVGALLHDIGKGRGGDHTAIGMDLIRSIGPRLGFPPADVDVLTELVRHHLLLSEVATRRDLNDDATITTVADAVGSIGTLELLAALTEADSVATGPAAWGTWKADLVSSLVARTAGVLQGGSVGDIVRPTFPSPQQFDLLRAAEPFIHGEGDTLLLVTPDRSGVFSRVAGVLALHGLGVLAADAHGEDGWAIEQFRVTTGISGATDWTQVEADAERALRGRLAVPARLAARAHAYARRRSPVSSPPLVRFDDAASAVATVLEVHAADSVGLLYRITRALADLDLDIRRAKVQTLGDSVVDAFYLCDANGQKLSEPALCSEIERAVLHAITSG